MSPHADFENQAPAGWSGDAEDAPILKFERPDWTLFRTPEGLAQKAGVSVALLRRLVLKELAALVRSLDRVLPGEDG